VEHSLPVELKIKNYFTLTWIGLAAISQPATLPPTTRPSGPARDMLRPPFLLLTPPDSLNVYDPVNDSISNRPCSKFIVHVT